MAMPSNEEVSGQSIQQFTEQLLKTMELPKLDKFKSLVQQLAEENELDIADMAAALAFENQKERPLFPKLETIKAPPSRERERDSKRDRNKDRGERKERRGQKAEGRD